MGKSYAIEEEDKDIQLTLSIPLPPNCPSANLWRLTIEAIRFLLYQRQQIPEPFQLLSRLYSQDDRKKTEPGLNSLQSRLESRIQKQVCSFLQSLKDLENSLESAFDKGSIREVHVCIGPTPISAREIYCIEFSDFIFDDAPFTVSPQVEKLCCQKLCSTLFQRDEYFLHTSQLSTVHVFLNTTKGSLSKGWLPWPQYKVNPKKVQLSLSLSPNLGKSQQVERNKENIGISANKQTTLEGNSSYLKSSSLQETSEVKSPDVRNCSDNSNLTNSDNSDSGDAGCCDKQESVNTPDGVSDESESSQCSTQDLISEELMSSLSLKSDSINHQDSYMWYRASIPLKGFKY